MTSSTINVRLAKPCRLIYDVKDENIFLYNYYTSGRYSLGSEMSDKIKKGIDLENIVRNLPQEELNPFLELGILQTGSGQDSFPWPILEKSLTPPLNIVLWHITKRCICNCKHCYVEAGRECANTDINWKLVIDYLKDAKVLSVNITGGEPGLHDGLLDIIKELDGNCIHIEGIFTAGGLPLDLIKFIANFHQCLPLYVSLDGISEKIHDQFRQSGGNYKKVLRLINQAVSFGLGIRINTILHPELLGSGKDFIEFLNKLEISAWRVEPPFMAGRAKHFLTEYNVSVNDEIQFYKEVLISWKKLGKPFHLELGQIFRSQIEDVGERTHSIEESSCEYYRDECIIYPNGDVGCCACFDQKIGMGENLSVKPLSQIWESSTFQKSKLFPIKKLLTQPEFEECRTCEYLDICGLGCRANALHASGTPWGFDSLTCERMRKGLPMLKATLGSYKKSS